MFVLQEIKKAPEIFQGQIMIWLRFSFNYLVAAAFAAA